MITNRGKHSKYVNEMCLPSKTNYWLTIEVVLLTKHLLHWSIDIWRGSENFSRLFLITPVRPRRKRFLFEIEKWDSSVAPQGFHDREKSNEILSLSDQHSHLNYLSSSMKKFLQSLSCLAWMLFWSFLKIRLRLSDWLIMIDSTTAIEIRSGNRMKYGVALGQSTDSFLLMTLFG